MQQLMPKLSADVSISGGSITLCFNCGPLKYYQYWFPVAFSIATLTSAVICLNGLDDQIAVLVRGQKGSFFILCCFDWCEELICLAVWFQVIPICLCWTFLLPLPYSSALTSVSYLPGVLILIVESCLQWVWDNLLSEHLHF